MKFITPKGKILIVPLLVLLIYLILPTTNSSIDSWGYALYVKQGINLFLPHHLFHNTIGFLWVNAIGFFIKVDTLKLLIILNAFFAAATIYLLGLTLKTLGVEFKRNIVWVAFLGSSWCIMRYATENETYIIPLFFSILGSYYLVKGLKGSGIRSFFYSGLFAATACLFHQVMFFWWISLLIGVMATQKIKPIICFALPALLVPISYLLVLLFYNNQPFTVDAFLRFVFNDYYSGAAGVSTGLSSLMFTAIGLFRSFFQVHGYLVLLPRISNLFIIAGVFSVVLIAIGIFNVRRIQWNIKGIKRPTVWVHLLALFLQLVFAFSSSGNAEFMVMIPILLAIVLSQVMENEIRFLGLTAAGMFIWNISLGLVPLNRYILDSNRHMSKIIIEGKQNTKKQFFVLYNKPNVENRVEYITGVAPSNIISGSQFDDINRVKQKICKALANDSIILTDCINRPKTLSRETLIDTSDFKTLFKDYHIKRLDSIQTITGKYYVHQIMLK